MSVDLLVLVVLGWMAFAAVNGMNDLSALSATLVSTRALSGRNAALLAAAGLWLGVMFGVDVVSRTVAVDLVSLHPPMTAVSMLSVWLGAVLGAQSWGWLARRAGIPTSATHAYVGALCGATLIATGNPDLVNWGLHDLVATHRFRGVMKVFASLIFSPLLGGGLGYALHRIFSSTLRRSGGVRVLECMTVFVQCGTYGLNDVHGLMGLVVGALMAAGAWRDPGTVPLWVKLAAGVAMSLGAAAGSLRISRMMARGVISVQPVEALSAQLAATSAVLLAGMAAAPVSSTQVTSSALVGVGGAWRPRHVRWGKVREIVLTWVVTFPCALAVGAVLTAVVRVLTI